jgi:FkbM family methyltransferase
MLNRLLKSTLRKGANSLGVVVARPAGLYREMEPFVLSRFFKLYDTALVLDIGANAGQYATMLRTGAGYRGRIVSCEPNPQLIDGLRRDSASDDGWTIQHCAVSDAPGTATLHITASDEMSSLARPAAEDIDALADLARVVGDVEVPCTTVDALIDEHDAGAGQGAIFVKIDTQGWERNVVAGMRRHFDRLSCVQMELTFKEIYENSWTYQQAIARMDELGFELAALIPNNAGHFPFLVEMDGIFRNTNLPMEAELRGGNGAMPMTRH